jgi:hypothetical protein
VKRYFTTKEIAAITDKHPSTVRRNLNPVIPSPRGNVYSVRDIGKLKR